MLSPKTKRNIQRIIPFGLVWLFLGWIFLFIEMAAMGGWENTPSSAVKVDINVFIFASLAVSFVGMIIGTIELLYLNTRFASRSFGRKILYKFLIYSFLLSIVIFITFSIASAIENKVSVFDALVFNNYLEFVTSYTHLSTALQMTVSLILSLLYTEINDTIGNNFLINFFTGKYHQPQEEQRIFMFVDMKSSTTHAEQLGNKQYFRLLKAYYNFISDAIVRNAGEIYQYVGDEIIVSWKLKNNQLDNNCIDCFFDMKADLKKQEIWFKNNFDVVPTFKAGLHLGKVTAGEIGKVKKDILFSGDVLNATARIQGLCNDYGVDILVSSVLINHLDLSRKYIIKSMGTNELRGRREQIFLFSVSEEK